MEPLHFTCPHCQARLKTRDRLSVGRSIPCPECGETFELVAQHAGTQAVKQPTNSPLANIGWKLPAVVLAGVVAALLCGVGSAWILTRPNRTAVAQVDHTAPVVPAMPDKPAPLPENPAVKVRTPVEERFAKLSAVLTAMRGDTQQFPRAASANEDLPVERRFSWLAALERHVTPRDLPLVWEKNWRDPLNDAFVRRRIPEFQNPLIQQLTGEDGYPAGHFAGVTGVGNNSGSAAATDPAAGVFGWDRATREAEIRDGLSQTLLVVGVQQRLGSWAAGGDATARALTREPYINGPDGLGTGAPDGMFALLADGSVRWFSVQTDASVLRRMAAICDESPVSPPVPVPPKVAAVDPALDIPLEPEFVDDEPDVLTTSVIPAAQIERALELQLAKYHFSPTAKRMAVLRELAEMTGVAVVIDRESLADAARKLEEPVGSGLPALRDTTVRQVLMTLLMPIGMQIAVEPGALRLMLIE